MNMFSKIFAKIAAREFDGTMRLGNPLGRDSGPFLVRMNNMSRATGGRGFTTPKREPRVDSEGRTRGHRKRYLREWANQAERERQERVCNQIAQRTGASFDELKVQFGSL